MENTDDEVGRGVWVYVVQGRRLEEKWKRGGGRGVEEVSLAELSDM